MSAGIEQGLDRGQNLLTQPLLVKGFAEAAAAVDLPFRNDDRGHIQQCYCHFAPQMSLAGDGAILRMD
jgi:hypothetical protein